jgi:uncharacterized glyoxalase superfamily protein PhnB
MMIDALVPLLGVADVERSIAFYTEILPFQVVEKTTADGKTRWALLRCGPAALMIGQADRAGGGAVLLHLYVEDVRACRDALRAKGTVTTGIRPEPYGVEAFRLRDPDGHELAIASPAVRIA